jgi:hypothetical protein
MNGNARIKPLFAAAICAVLACAQSASADETYTMSYNVDAGSEVDVGDFALPGSPGCVDHGVKITIVKPPDHGKINIRTGDFVYAKGSITPCVGKTITGSKVYYTPDPGYKGEDHFEFTIAYTSLVLDKKVNVTVN